MDKIELAKMIFDWRELKAKADLLEQMIIEEIKKEKETVKVGDTVASYRSGKRTFDYETPGRLASKEVIDNCSKPVINYGKIIEELQKLGIMKELEIEYPNIFREAQSTVTDWKEVCKIAKFTPIVSSTAEPSITLYIEK